jgi:hypothetical protein
MGVLGQLANFEGVAEIIRDYQKSNEPWYDNDRVPCLNAGVAAGRGSERRWGLSGSRRSAGKRTAGLRERGCPFACADQNSGGGQRRADQNS